MLLTAKRYELALKMYKKLRNCAHTHKDIIMKAYGTRQMAYCFKKLERYEHAVTCFKYILAIAWTIKLPEMEFAAYEGLAQMHLYLGNIQKVKFYDARMSHGQYEPENSQSYKISVS